MSDAAEKNRRFQDHLANKGGGVRMSETVRLPVFTLDVRQKDPRTAVAKVLRQKAPQLCAERAGEQARLANRPRSACPYRSGRGSGAFQAAWLRGWEREDEPSEMLAQMIHPGPYICMMCGKEPDGYRGENGWWMEAPFEVDDGYGGTTKDEAWIYCKPCDAWTAFAPIPDDPMPATDATPRQD